MLTFFDDTIVKVDPMEFSGSAVVKNEILTMSDITKVMAQIIPLLEADDGRPDRL
jgi:hypothetical protein